MGLRSLAFAFMMLSTAGQIAACTSTGCPQTRSWRTSPFYSANGRFCAVVRWYEGVADFTCEAGGESVRFDDGYPPTKLTQPARVFRPRGRP